MSKPSRQNNLDSQAQHQHKGPQQNQLNCKVNFDAAPKIAKGTWVEIERVLLKPEERAPNLPEDTRKCPYVLRVSGFLQEEAEIGSDVKIRSLIGHEHAGVLRVVNPSYSHSFGTTIPELLTIGTQERS